MALTRTSSIGPSTRYRIEQYRPLLAAEGIAVVTRPLFGPTWFAILRLRNAPLRIACKALYSAARLLVRLVQLARTAAAAPDLVLVEQQLFPYLPAWIEAALWIRSRPTILEFDDAIYLTPGHGRKLARLCSLATVVIVGNRFLAEFAGRHARRVVVVPTTVDVARYADASAAPPPPADTRPDSPPRPAAGPADSAPAPTTGRTAGSSADGPGPSASQAPAAPPPSPAAGRTGAVARTASAGPHRPASPPSAEDSAVIDSTAPGGGPAAPAAPSRPLRIAWIGLPYNLRYLDVLAGPLRRLREEGVAVELRVISAAPPDPARFAGVDVVPRPWSERSEAGELAACDVGVMPLPDDEWARGKCALKLLQYMASGLPVVASPVGVNADIIRHGENGMLARDADEWLAALRRLAAEPQTRRRLGAAGRRTVEAGYSLPRGARQLADTYRLACRETPAASTGPAGGARSHGAR